MTEPIGEAAQYYAAGDLLQAARCCLDLIARDPGHFDALHLLGVICARRGHGADAVGYLLRAEALQAENARLQANIGNAFGIVQRFDKAVDAYRKALALNPGDPGVANNLGLALQGLGRRTESIESFQAALVLNPEYAPARFNLARALATSGDLEAAEAMFRTLLASFPPGTADDRITETANELAHVIMLLGRPADSLAVLREAEAKRTDGAPKPWNEALVLLTMGRYAEGWPAYEARWLAPNHDPAPRDYSVLDLDQVAGKRVLLIHEQGRGDIIQFMRYIPLLAARGARIKLSVYNDLIPLARELPDVEQAAGPDDVVQYDLLTSIMSLPLAFRTELSTIPAEVPYLRTPAARVARMRHHLGPKRAPRIGLAWSGSPASYARSAMPASMLDEFLRRDGVEFHCLQNDMRPDDREWLTQIGRVTTHEAMLSDFADTAALIESMDLVVSIDTAVAHLAGALAKPVWLMLPFSPDWRWMMNREDSPWYPTARLFRQTTRGDWAGVVRSVAAACQL